MESESEGAEVAMEEKNSVKAAELGVRAGGDGIGALHRTKFGSASTPCRMVINCWLESNTGNIGTIWLGYSIQQRSNPIPLTSQGLSALPASLSLSPSWDNCARYSSSSADGSG
jgi:hypothetical protein